MRNMIIRHHTIGLLGLLLFIPSGYADWVAPLPQTVEEIADRVSARLDSLDDLPDFKVNVISTLHTMDKDWEPTKTEVVEKIVSIQGKRRIEEILSALEKKRGKVKDLTEKYRKDARKRNEKALREPEESQERGRRDLDLTLKEYMPFTADRRGEFTFRLIGESQWGGQPVYLVGATAREESDRRWNGTYFIHRESFQILRAEISPSKKPGVLKRFIMELDFQSLPGDHLVLLKSRIQIHVGLVVKNIRVVAEESYSDYAFQPPD